MMVTWHMSCPVTRKGFSMKLKRFAILFVLVSLCATLFASVSSFAAGEAVVNDTFSYTSIVDFVIAKLYAFVNGFTTMIGIGYLSPDILLPAFAAVVLVVGVAFLIFGFSTWKVVLRFIFFAIAFLLGYIGGITLLGLFDSLRTVPYMEFLPHALGLILGVVSCFFSSFCLRFSIFMTSIALSITLLPAVFETYIGEELIFSHVLFDVAYLAIGVIIGYLMAFPLMRPLMSLMAAAFAGFCTAFGAFVLFAEGFFASKKLDVNLYFWICVAAIAALSIVIQLIVHFVSAGRAQKKALALAA